MTNEDFNKLFEQVVEHERAMLGMKSNEYAGGGDRLWNFRGGAGITGQSPAQTLWGYLSQHLASVRDIANGKRVSRETLREKIGDSRNYLLLLEALMLDGVVEQKIDDRRWEMLDGCLRETSRAFMAYGNRK